MTTTASTPDGTWVKILQKGMITIPKKFRTDLGIKQGNMAKIRKEKNRLIIEPLVEPANEKAYETFSTAEIETFLADDTLPDSLARKAQTIWKDIP